MSSSSDRIARKMTYEKERRERISQLFKSLAEALLDAGLPQEAADTQVEALESAIEIVKKWKAQKCASCERRDKRGSPVREATSQDVGAVPDFSLVGSPSDLEGLKSSRSSTTMSTSSRASLSHAMPDMARRHSSDLTAHSEAASTRRSSSRSLSQSGSLKRRRSFESLPQDSEEPATSKPKEHTPPRKTSPMHIHDVNPMAETSFSSYHFGGQVGVPAVQLTPQITVYPPAPTSNLISMSELSAMTLPMPPYSAPFSSHTYAMSLQSSVMESVGPIASAPYTASNSDSFDGSAEFVEDMRLIDRMDYYSDYSDEHL